MSRLLGIAAFAFYCAVVDIREALSDDTTTDVNIVTALDISESIDAVGMRIMIEGMAQAIAAPEVLSAIRNGRHHQIGFAVFAWHQGIYPEIVSWSLIETQSDTEVVAARIMERLNVDIELEARTATGSSVGRMTDLSGAIDHTSDMLLKAPYGTDRNVINIVGNGRDNFGVEPASSRDAALDRGATINGAVLGADRSLYYYYRLEVIGGPGAFVLSADDPTKIAEMLARKFRFDIAMAR